MRGYDRHVSTQLFKRDCWGVVLATNHDARLEDLTRTDDGVLVPKPFCSMNGSHCLLQDAIEHAGAVAAGDRICVVVAREDRSWWDKALAQLAPRNIIVQPEDRGSGCGILLSVLSLALRAHRLSPIVVLPAEHFVRNEHVLKAALKHLVRHVRRDPHGVYLLGGTPESADPDLGYILPWYPIEHDPVGVYQFVEKPNAEQARQLLRGGALWNTFILAGTTASLLRLYEPRHTTAMLRIRGALYDARHHPAAVTQAYAQLDAVDFGSQVLSPHVDYLRVLRLPPCGWSDLGTISRVARAAQARTASPQMPGSYLNLAERVRVRNSA
jgi:mannose-1-phosphate guanylyltransferase